MTPERRQSILVAVTGVGLTALLTACVLFGLLSRLGDAAGARWAGRFATFAAVVTIAGTALASLSANGARHRTGERSGDREEAPQGSSRP